MKRIKLLFSSLVIAMAMLGLPLPGPSFAASAITIAPTSITDIRGLSVGAVGALATSDQTGQQDTPADYVALTTPTTRYIGRYSYVLPSGVSPSSVQSLVLQANYRGPVKSSQAWNWFLYDWRAKTWVNVGNNATSDGTNWDILTFAVPPARTARFINNAGQIYVQVRASNSKYDADLDYMVLQVTQKPSGQPGNPPPPPTTPGAPSPVVVPGTWNLIWQDEFNGTSLDLTKWQPNWFGATNTSVTQYINSAEGQCFDPANVSEGNGELDLNLIAKTCPTSAGKSAGMPYTGSMISSRTHFTFTYGVVETRMWVNGSDQTRCNNWDSFWLNGLTVAGREEYDIAECLGNSFNFHLNPGSIFGGSNKSTPISNGWHLFTMDWEPTGATVYYDSTLIGTITKSVYTAPMYILYENATHGTTNVVAPDVMRIDYVRVWQK